MAFLEIVTRHMTTRPNMLAANQASLAALEDGDWSQMLVVDEVGRGVPWANANLATIGPALTGEYVWVLDDDDLCILPSLVGDLKDIVARHDPDVVFVQMDHGPLRILPDGRQWGREPVLGGIGVSAVIVRRSVWQAHAGAWGNVYEGDFTFIRALWDSRPRVIWWHVVASKITRRSVGRPE